MRIDRFFIESEAAPITGDMPEWHRPLPSNRKNERPETANSLTYGEYFTAVRAFLERDNFKVLVDAANQIDIKADIHIGDIDCISVLLVKHGAFYHPSRVDAVICGHTRRFVLNVAVSAAGHRYIESECCALKRLNTESASRFIPVVYAEGDVQIENTLPVKMFLAEWFDLYHEFHISLDSEGRKRLQVWDTGNGKYFLTERQEREVYRKSASILTAFYHPETFEQVYPWHHAAGDFVIKKENDDIDVKLITVRRYASLGDGESGESQTDPGATLQALLVFFLNLSIRMRLDRIDGVGDIVWSSDCAVKAFTEGFLKALMAKPPLKPLLIPLYEGFIYYLATAHTENSLYDLALEIVNAYSPALPEVPLIKANLKKHIHDLSGFIIDLAKEL